MSPRQEALLYVLQRITALVMAPLVVIHLAVMIMAVEGGLSTTEMLTRTQSSTWWPLVYGLFFVASGIHGAIGFRNILREMTVLPLRSINTLSGGLLVIILVFGIQTVRAIS